MRLRDNTAQLLLSCAFLAVIFWAFAKTYEAEALIELDRPEFRFEVTPLRFDGNQSR